MLPTSLRMRPKTTPNVALSARSRVVTTETPGQPHLVRAFPVSGDLDHGTQSK